MLRRIVRLFKAIPFKARKVFAITLIGLSIFGLSQLMMAPSPVTKLPATTAANQIEVLTYSQDLSALQDNIVRKAEGLLPVKVLPTNSYLSLVKSSTPNITDAVLNPDTRITAVAVKEGKEKTNLYATYFLNTQSDALMELYSSGKASVRVTPTGSSSGGYASYGRYTALSPYLQNSQKSSGGGSLLPFIGFALFIGLVVTFARYTHNKSKVQAKEKEKAEIPTTRFTDVAGCDEALEDIREYVTFIKNPERFTRVGALPPKGALLVGPPGTGKTLLARAIAGEAGIPFFSASGSDFTEIYVGVGAKRVRELFQKAREHSEGAIIFIDEIDSIGRARGKGLDGNNSEQEGTLNALLVEMDGFKKSKIIVIGATNRDDMLDAALTRPGRFDKKIHVPLPDRVGREKILQVHTRLKPIASDVDLDLIARRTHSMSGADLAQVVNEACMFAARDGRDIVSYADFSDSIETVFMGKARTSAIVNDHDRTITAWHEAGHTVSAMVLKDAENPLSVSIIPRGPAGGITWMDSSDNMFMTRKNALARLVVAMSGRAAEELLLDGEFTSGPHGDLTSATQVALTMVTQYGMSDGALMVKNERMINDKNMEAVEVLLTEALQLARKTLNDNRELFDNVVANLLEFDTLSNEQLIALRDGAKIAPPTLPSAPKNNPKKSTKPKQSIPEDLVKEVFTPLDKPASDLFDRDSLHIPNPFRRKRRKAFFATLLSTLILGSQVISEFRKSKRADENKG